MPPTEINMDTLIAYLKAKYPEREGDSEEDFRDMAEMVKELKGAGYGSLLEVDRDIDRAVDAFAKYEAHVRAREWPNRTTGNYFSAAGAARKSLSLASDNYYKQTQSYRFYKERRDRNAMLDYRNDVKWDHARTSDF
jgi:hypothetical protein